MNCEKCGENLINGKNIIKPALVYLNSNKIHKTVVFCNDLCKLEYEEGLPKKKMKFSKSEEKILEIYVDGACSNNGTDIARASIGVYFGKEDNRNKSEVIEMENPTNNKAELCALLCALTEVWFQDIVKIYTDSNYVYGMATKWRHEWKKRKWKNVKNLELVKAIDDSLESYGKRVKIIWIRREKNKNADKLAKDALKREED